MTAPVIHAAAEQVYRLLPDYVQAADEATDWTLRRYVGACAVGLEKLNEFLTMVDPDTSVTGTCEIVNPAATPRAYLAWLGWLVGLDTSVFADSYVRAAVANAAVLQNRGTRASIINAVQNTLTGTKSVRFYSNLSGIDPYLITILTLTSETASVPATLAAAWAEKPAGVNLTVTATTGPVWADAVANYATWNATVAAKATWQALITAIP